MSVRFFVSGNSSQDRHSMTRGGLKQIYLVLMLGISLFIPLFLTYSVYADLSETRLLSSDMNFEGSDDGDSPTCQNEIKVFVPQVSSDPLLIGTHFVTLSYLFSSSLTSPSQNSPVLRC